MPMDLASLIEPYAIDAPRLGPILVEARKKTFDEWFEAGDRYKRWADGKWCRDWSA